MVTIFVLKKNLSALRTIYSGTFPLGHLYSRDTSIQRTQNLVAKKMFT